MKEYDTLVAKAVQDDPFAFLDTLIGEKARNPDIANADITLLREAGRVIASLFTERQPWHPNTFENRDRSYDVSVSETVRNDPFKFLDKLIAVGQKQRLESGDEFIFRESAVVIASLFTRKQPWQPVPEEHA